MKFQHFLTQKPEIYKIFNSKTEISNIFQRQKKQISTFFNAKKTNFQNFSTQKNWNSQKPKPKFFFAKPQKALLFIHRVVDIVEQRFRFVDQVFNRNATLLTVKALHRENFLFSHIFRPDFDTNRNALQLPVIEFPPRRDVVSERILFYLFRSIFNNFFDPKFSVIFAFKTLKIMMPRACERVYVEPNVELRGTKSFLI